MIRWGLALAFVLVLPAVVQAQSANLTWTWAQGTGGPADGFKVQRATGACTLGTLTWADIGQTPLATMTYKDSTVAYGAAYCYRVAAYNATGWSPFSNTAGLTVTVPLPTAAPSLQPVTQGP